jgi:inward rectifier potassium channel
MARKQRPQTIRIGDREFVARGIPRSFWSDLYYRSMTVSWPLFFVGAAIVFVVLNCGFAALYMLGNNPIANIRPDAPIDYFYFSIETLATVGYGDMHPQTSYGHLIATVEIFTGMSFLAVMTGLVFARFSRPHARFIFAQNPVVAMGGGVATLMIRLANARHNTISGAHAKLWLIRAEPVQEGGWLRRYYPLPLQRSENPIFVLSWTLFHLIDESSPLFGMTEDDLARTEATLMLSVNGHDDNSSQELYARYSYSHRDIRWRHQYVDITSTRDGRAFIDYTKFHDTVEETQRQTP